ncbi:cyclase family protein [Ramlibacter sp. WS9]|uniref:cyclase family protein n=1 Tax=Ramlibacter sp. WS9 TaxID=1882741 RepID=UPI0013054484|nr:cyclase family protein [Ramlibacter sp. WS9]
MKKLIAIGAIGLAAISGAVLTACGSAEGSPILQSDAKAKPLYLDLTHEIPTFAPLASDPAKPDLTQPHAHSQPVPSFFRQVALQPSENHFDDGHFYRSYMTIAEHFGTHIDAPAHYVNVPGTVEADATLPRRFQNQLTLADLTGPIVLVDIGQRVQAQLDKNGGTPSPQKTVMDFSEASPNNVTAQDIAAVADKLQNGSWIVVNTGWSRFYKGGDLATSPYINGWNFPGVSGSAIEALIALEKQKGIRINGIAIDNIGIDSGEGQAGHDASFTGHIYASHVRGLQRGWKFIENATNLASIASAKADSCTLIAGALPLVIGSGSPARVIAICEK